MQTNSIPLPEIQRSEIDAVRRFLTDGCEDARPSRRPRDVSSCGAVTVRHGIARARLRSAAKAAPAEV